ncbi:lipopolysaccharide assembly protein LapA domain-containing protein [Congregibacter sp.]|uniref:lipopolysaccharide assembly protein LapA domain-containing protein n=1 Tax=Congregibacter sp. TaxID=2744308 RepID=UPI003F6B40CC
MGFLRKLLALILAAAMAAVGVLFALQNAQPVPLDVLFMILPPRSLALWVLGALALGGVLGLLLSSFAVLRLRARLMAARRQIANSQAELDQLRAKGLVSRE